VQGIRDRRFIVGALVSGLAAATLAMGAAPAGAAEGDSFYLLNTKNTFVSFAVLANSDEASRMLFSVRRIPCKPGSKHPTIAMGYFHQRPAPIDDGAFFVSWSPITDENGGIRGKHVDADTASGRFNLDFADCSTHRKWTAKTVSEKRWNAVREKKFGSYADPPSA